jgi:hypothetical protein
MFKMMLALIPVTLFALVGCDYASDTVIYPDGSGAITVEMEMDQEVLEKLGGAANMGQPGGGEAQQLDVEAMETNLVSRVYFSDVAGTMVSADGQAWTWTENEDGGFTLEGMIETSQLDQLEQQMMGLAMMGVDPGEDPLSTITVKYVYTLPGNITETNLPNREGRSAWFEATAKDVKEGKVAVLKERVKITCGAPVEGLDAEHKAFLEKFNSLKKDDGDAEKAPVPDESGEESGE